MPPPLRRRVRLAAAARWLSLRRRIHGLCPQDIGLLAGIQKSGNTYLRYLLANYLAQLARPGRPPLTYPEMSSFVGETLGLWEVTPRFRRGPDLTPLGVRRFYYTHHAWSPLYAGWRVVHVYRNPLDFLVSFYFYKYAGRSHGEPSLASPREAFFHLDQFFRAYKSFLGTPALRLAYEDLLEFPEQQLQRVLGFFGAPEMDQQAVLRAVASSRREVIRAEEDRNGPIHAPPGFKGRFVRDGSIGQHRSYFEPQDWSKLEGIAARHSVSLDEFRFEPAAAALKAPVSK